MEQLVNFIIRPPRAEYDPKNDLLDEEFMLKGKWFQRKDLEVKNSRGDALKCSHYMPITGPEGKPLPCVIYCHGNSGCRADASEAAIILLPSNITVFTLDFSGSGLSEGEHVTLGWNERNDLKAVVEYLRQDGNVSLIGLWGRSMGAVTSLMYGAEDPSIAGMVLDSPFSDLVDLMMELVDTYKIRLPKFTVKFAIQYMKRAVLKKAKFDITELNTIKVAKTCFVPVLIGHACDDDFIRPHHSDRIFEAYMGDKNIIKFEGDHNSPRPQFYFDSISIFFNNVLQPPDDELGDTFFGMSHNYFGKIHRNNIHDVGSRVDVPITTVGAAASSTEDCIKQLRSKRPMSKTEVPSNITANDKQYEDKEAESGANLLASSSSNMISFELSNGDTSDQNMPASIDDDEYVEYSLNDLVDFPSSMEEEERMLMEAVLESLKDIELTTTAHVDLSNCLPETLHQSISDSSTSKQSVPMNEPPEADPNRHSFENEKESNKTYPHSDKSVVHETGSNETSPHSDKPVVPMNESLADVANVHLPTKETESSKASPFSDTSQSVTSAPLVDHTNATVTVVKNQSGNSREGLVMRCWDLSFFKSK
ncbi:unnamed protein product [Cuscuta epithymum]|uniref:Serine aminopeptidase S33 domain-containing protein n=1 Tax=Cuscuta epithymum TaxID=186058 RepID=A0AAV0EEM2_9ASTE|nr:unnamed protein product [Cuscuta epithymum]